MPRDPPYASAPPPWLGQPGRVGDIYLNAIGLAERLDYAQLYRVEPPGHRLNQGFNADMCLGVAHRTAPRPHLFCFDAIESAVAYGAQRYGTAFILYSLDAHGLPAVPYRLHAALCELLGDVRANGAAAYRRGDVYLDIERLTQQRIGCIPAFMVAAILRSQAQARASAQEAANGQASTRSPLRRLYGRAVRSCAIV